MPPMAKTNGVPDMRFINRHVAVADVARALELRLDGNKIHCWRPERHKNGDRSASVGIRKSNNTVKCFGCDTKPVGPIDLAMDVLSVDAAQAALWIAGRFEVPVIPRRRREAAEHLAGPVGYEQGLELLIRSGLFGLLSESARCVAPVLLAKSIKERSTDSESLLRMSYRGIMRYSGVRSPNAIKKALSELAEIGFLRVVSPQASCSPRQPIGAYVITPNSDELYELANAFSIQMKNEIAAERKVRARLRGDKLNSYRRSVLA